MVFSFLSRLFRKKKKKKKASDAAAAAAAPALVPTPRPAATCPQCNRRLVVNGPCPFCAPQHFGEELPEGTVMAEHESSSRVGGMGGIVVAFQAAQEHGAGAFLHVYEGNNKGATVLIATQPVTIGRSAEANTFALNDGKVSTRHCEVRFEAETLYLFDRGAKNGVYLNDERVTDKVALDNGDTIGLGGTRLYVGLVG